MDMDYTVVPEFAQEDLSVKTWHLKGCGPLVGYLLTACGRY